MAKSALTQQMADAMQNDLLQQYVSELQNQLGATVNQTKLQQRYWRILTGSIGNDVAPPLHQRSIAVTCPRQASRLAALPWHWRGALGDGVDRHFPRNRE